MALFYSFPSQFQLLQSHRNYAIPNPSVSETPIPQSIFPLVSSVSFSARTNLRYPSLQSRRCSTSSSSSVQQDMSPATRIFIKGTFFSKWARKFFWVFRNMPTLVVFSSFFSFLINLRVRLVRKCRKWKECHLFFRSLIFDFLMFSSSSLR
jgi:hypothetical protein